MLRNSVLQMPEEMNGVSHSELYTISLNHEKLDSDQTKKKH